MENCIKINFFFWDERENAERIESLWAAPIESNYQIENIPFYIREYSFKDIVSAKQEEDGLYINELIHPSGHSTIRIIFFDKSVVKKTREQLERLGCDSEGSERFYYVAVDVPPNVNYKTDIRPFLEKGFSDELWDFEESNLSDQHK